MRLAGLRRRVSCWAAGLLLVAGTGCGPGQVAEEREPAGPWSLDGKPVGRQQMNSYSGYDHCGWQSVHFLEVSWPPELPRDDPHHHRRTFVKDPEAVLGHKPYLHERYRAGVALPADAVATGYQNDGYALWSR